MAATIYNCINHKILYVRISVQSHRYITAQHDWPNWPVMITIITILQDACTYVCTYVSITDATIYRYVTIIYRDTLDGDTVSIHI